MRKPINNLANSGSVVLHSGLVILGKYLQGLAKAKEIHYSFLVGHLSDYSTTAAAASFYLCIPSFSKKRNLGRVIAPLVLGGLYSCAEYTGSFLSWSGMRYDPWDIASYWLGVGVALSIDCLSARISRKESIESTVG